jgi:nitrite reductase/ring-hydroxylating ferredoxin subunit
MLSTPIKSLVDVERGIVSREVFVNQDVYAEEQEKVFAHTWLFVGHESQVGKPGDYFSSYMGEDPVVLTRDRQGRIHVFLNSCRHRGMKVCRYDEGNTPVFTCPYHGWSYGLDGSLVGVPRFNDGYYGELDKREWGLAEARTCTYKGTIWATWDNDLPEFTEYLGGFRIFLDGTLDSFEGDDGNTEVLGGVHKWVIPSNWKFVSENFNGDHYHHPTHISVEAVGIGPGRVGETRHSDVRTYRKHMTSFPALGHGWRGGPPVNLPEVDIYPFPRFDLPEAEAYFQSAYEKRRARPDKWPPTWLFGGGGNIFPNASFHIAFPRSICVAHPRGPLQTEVWRWYLVDKNFPDAVKDHFRHYYLRYSGPAGMTEQDDMENWCYATVASKGPIARRLPYNYQLALGHGGPHPSLDGAWVSEGEFSEANALTMYGHWARLMAASPAAST